MSARYRRREPFDALIDDGEALLLLEPDRVVRLSPIATAVVEATAHATPLVTLVEAKFGTPVEGSIADALRALLESFVAADVLERVDHA